MNISRTVFGLVVMLTIAACATPVFSQTPDNPEPGAVRPGPSHTEPGIANDRLPFKIVDGKVVFQQKRNPDLNGAVMNASAETLYAPVTEVRERWDTTAGAWENATMTTWTYNGSNWANASKTTYAFDGSGRPSQMGLQSWNGSEWVNNQRSTSTYDGSGYLTETLTESWLGTMWLNSLRSTYTYDGAGHPTSFI